MTRFVLAATRRVSAAERAVGENTLRCASRLTRSILSIRDIHGDQRGAISLLSVFGIFLFTILLGQVMNVGRQIDDKLRMQNAADAAAYSGAVGIARGMNAIAFSNHILCETFALTAYMREARDRHSDPLVPPILAAWQSTGERFAQRAQSGKFRGLGEAIVEKVPVEQQMVDQFSEMAFRQSRVTLPALEYLLMGPDQNPRQPLPPDPLGGFIPRFQRAIVQNTPALSLAAADDLARRYGQSSQSMHRGEPLRGFFWRTNVEVAGTGLEFDPLTRTLPAIDPSPTGPDTGIPQAGCYYCLSRTRRSELAHHYLRNWINHWQGPYFEWDGSGPRGHATAKMSNYINLFRVFSCGQLDRLLNEEYPNTNLPHVLREILPEHVLQLEECLSGCSLPLTDTNRILERDYNFMATAHWPQMQALMPGLFQNPFHRGLRTYAVTFAQTEVYLPQARFTCCPWATPVQRTDPGTGLTTIDYIPHYDNWPRTWDLFNQNWTVRLVPATASTAPDILQTHPQNFVPGVLSGYQPPNIGAAAESFSLINGH